MSPIVVSILGLTVASCTRVSAESVAERTFATYQEALFHGDRATLRRLLCHDCRPVLPELLAADLDGKQPLTVLRVTRHRDFEFHVHVRDPNAGDRESVYVLALEDGHMRIDLLTTTLHNSRTARTKLDRPVFVPQKLRPDEIRRARANQAASRR